MDSIKFESFIDSVVSELFEVSKITPTEITSCKSGDDFELCVVRAVNTVISKLKVNALVNHIPGSHVFPDIIIDFGKDGRYGIEVKSSSANKSKGWRINGNSIMGSTRDDSVIETYIVFGKTAKGNIDFKARRYTECVSNIVVTHSPRYLIDMELNSGDTFFDKSGIQYKDLVTSDNPIGLITAYFLAKGEKAWWLSDSTPAAVRSFCDISDEEKMECFGYGLAHFPELFERNALKYKRYATWLATERSLVSSSVRDDFSAGGKVSISVNGVYYKDLPQIFQRLLDYKVAVISALNNADAAALCDDWHCPHRTMDSINDKIKAWISIVTPHVAVSQLPKGVDPLILLNNIMRI